MHGRDHGHGHGYANSSSSRPQSYNDHDIPRRQEPLNDHNMQQHVGGTGRVATAQARQQQAHGDEMERVVESRLSFYSHAGDGRDEVPESARRRRGGRGRPDSNASARSAAVGGRLGTPFAPPSPPGLPPPAACDAGAGDGESLRSRPARRRAGTAISAWLSSQRLYHTADLGTTRSGNVRPVPAQLLGGPPRGSWVPQCTAGAPGGWRRKGLYIGFPI